ncbi:MAG TPA: hypothetical protein ENI88_04590 [Desulfobulbus sp.]|nr:hypothetical protein [Desulfobulbus sp.]
MAGPNFFNFTATTNNKNSPERQNFVGVFQIKPAWLDQIFLTLQPQQTIKTAPNDTAPRRFSDKKQRILPSRGEVAREKEGYGPRSTKKC